LVKQIAKGFSKPITTTPKPIVKPSEDTTPKVEPIQQTNLFGEPIITDSLSIPPVTIDVTLSDGKKVPLTIQGEKGATEQGLYNLTKNKDNHYTATINLRNPIFERFDKSLSTPEGQEQLAYIIEVMVATEISLAQGGEQGGVYFRNQFNSLFGAI
jgi:hypothetical protein